MVSLPLSKGSKQAISLLPTYCTELQYSLIELEAWAWPRSTLRGFSETLNRFPFPLSFSHQQPTSGPQCHNMRRRHTRTANWAKAAIHVRCRHHCGYVGLIQYWLTTSSDQTVKVLFYPPTYSAKISFWMIGILQLLTISQAGRRCSNGRSSAQAQVFIKCLETEHRQPGFTILK